MTDRRGMLKESPFAYAVAKDGRVRIAWHGRTVVTLQGREADRFLARVRGMPPHQAQLIMAKATGNFKRGNEKAAKRRGR